MYETCHITHYTNPYMKAITIIKLHQSMRHTKYMINNNQKSKHLKSLVISQKDLLLCIGCLGQSVEIWHTGIPKNDAMHLEDQI